MVRPSEHLSICINKYLYCIIMFVSLASTLSAKSCCRLSNALLKINPLPKIVTGRQSRVMPRLSAVWASLACRFLDDCRSFKKALLSLTEFDHM